jgi:dTDP-L-rhamnose 4-epimerase
MRSPVLITGGAGFIGCRLAGRLLHDGHDVVVLDSLHPQVHTGPGRPLDLPAEAELLIGDVTHADNWATVLKLVQPETVVHLAAETGTGQSLSLATRHGSVNVVGTTQMLDTFFASSQRPAHIVLASSRAVYGEGAWIGPDGVVRYPPPRRHDQLAAGKWDPRGPGGEILRPVASRAGVTEVHPTNVYAATKLAQEHICRAWCAATGTALSVLRLQNVYGPGQSLTNPYTGVLAFFARVSAAGAPIDVYEDGEIVRDFVFVDDVVSALSGCVARPPAVERLLDIGSGAPTTIRNVADTVTRQTGGPPPVVSGTFRDGDVRAAMCDGQDAAADLGYEPIWSLEKGIEALLGWVGEQGAV